MTFSFTSDMTMSMTEFALQVTTRHISMSNPAVPTVGGVLRCSDGGA